jgi:hypothetical protein
MLNGRLYRAAFVPLLMAIMVGAFSIGDRPAPIKSNLAGEQFDGVHAAALLDGLASGFPHRRPGSAGDARLAGDIARQMARPPGQTTAAGGSTPTAPSFTIERRIVQGQTIDGARNLQTVIATRQGTVTGQIVVLAHRDAAASGSKAELSGTAALLELSEVLSGRLLNHTITLVSTSGGSGGDAGAADFAAHPGGPVDAVIVLGDLAGRQARTPFVIPWSDTRGSAPLRLQRTVLDALNAELGDDGGQAGTAAQFAHLALPFATGEQGVLLAHGLPAVEVQASGERGPGSAQGVSPVRLQNFGRSVLRAVNALDAGPSVPAAATDGLVVWSKVVPAWAMRLLVAALLFPALLAGVDALARLRRRRQPVGRWLAWTLALAFPFFVTALLAEILGGIGILGAAPDVPVLPGALPVDAVALVAMGVVLGLAGAAGVVLIRALGIRERPRAGAAGLSVVLVLDAVAALAWLRNPYTALLLVPAVHLWLAIAAPELRPRAPFGLALVLIGVVLPVALIGLYAGELGLGLPGVAWTALLLVAGGHIGLISVALWSLCLGGLVGIATIAAVGEAKTPSSASVAGPDGPVSVRGPVSYAGPGSLGGTESALRR